MNGMVFNLGNGCNDDQYTKQGRIWELAKRNNEKPTKVTVRKVEKIKQLPLT